MYHNPLGPTAATGLSVGLGAGMLYNMWVAIAIFTLIGAAFALKRVMPAMSVGPKGRFYRNVAKQARGDASGKHGN